LHLPSWKEAELVERHLKLVMGIVDSASKIPEWGMGEKAIAALESSLIRQEELISHFLCIMTHN